MSYLKERIKHAVRFRHKRGYGVHSPFMFNLILNVIRDKTKCYTYSETIEKVDHLHGRKRKIFRLLSRLIRFLQSQRIVCLGNLSDLLADYLISLDNEAEIACNSTEALPTADFIYIGRNAQPFFEKDYLDTLLMRAEGKKCIVIFDIYKNGFNSRLWRQLREKSTVSIDMMWYGILLFDEKIQPGKYNLII
ncbi:MAG: hypothetical protein RR397_08515 [Odoribacter sp.]